MLYRLNKAAVVQLKHPFDCGMAVYFLTLLLIYCPPVIERYIAVEPDFSEFKIYHIHLLFRNDPDWHAYRIPFSDYGRIRNGFAGENDLFDIPDDWVQFVAYGGRRVLFRMSFLQLVHFSWDPIRGRIDEDPEKYENIRIFLAGRPSPIESGTSDNGEVFDFYNELCHGPCTSSGFIGYPDEEGEEIYINPEQAYMVEIPEFMLDGNDDGHDDEEIDDEDDGEENGF